MGLKDSFKKALQKKGSLSEATGKKGAGIGPPQVTKQTFSKPAGMGQSPTITAKDPGFWGILKGEKPYSIDLSPGEIGKFSREQVEISKKLEKNKSERSGWKRILKHPLKVLFEKPLNILIVTLPLAIIVFLL